MSDFFWFSDEQWARIEPLLPQDTRGMPRVDDRRVLSGIVHALKSGGRWGDCPEHVYGPKKTLYNRFRRWAERGVWSVFSPSLPEWTAFHPGSSSTVRASRFTAPPVAQKGGLGSWYRHHQRWPEHRAAGVRSTTSTPSATRKDARTSSC
jgi:transposase